MKVEDNNLVAVLGPTNTGKTYLAFERLLSYQSGIFGFPLRLLARENYDKAVKKIGINILNQGSMNGREYVLQMILLVNGYLHFLVLTMNQYFLRF